MVLFRCEGNVKNVFVKECEFPFVSHFVYLILCESLRNLLHFIDVIVGVHSTDGELILKIIRNNVIDDESESLVDYFLPLGIENVVFLLNLGDRKRLQLFVLLLGDFRFQKLLCIT